MADCPLCGHVTPCGRHAGAAPSAALPPLTAQRWHDFARPHTDPLSEEACRRLHYGVCGRLVDRYREAAPDPTLTYTDPAGGPDWEPREDEA